MLADGEIDALHSGAHACHARVEPRAVTRLFADYVEAERATYAHAHLSDHAHRRASGATCTRSTAGSLRRSIKAFAAAQQKTYEDRCRPAR
jgi:hypothetical protein